MERSRFPFEFSGCIGHFPLISSLGAVSSDGLFLGPYPSLGLICWAVWQSDRFKEVPLRMFKLRLLLAGGSQGQLF
jgi:hypothetical protein